MNGEDFFTAVRKLSPVQDEEAIRHWKGFVDVCVEHGQSIGFEATADGCQETEKWLDTLYSAFCFVKDSFGQEVTDALIALGSEGCCLYPGEMMQAAACLENGVNARQLLVLMDTGFLEADAPFSIMSREEAERQMAEAGIIPLSVPGKQKEPCQPGDRKTAPEDTERAGNDMAGWKTQAEVAMIRKRYPVGSRIELDYMNEQGMPPGLKGIVKSVDDAGQLHMIWENGRSLALVPGPAQFRRLPEPQVEVQVGKDKETEEMER